MTEIHVILDITTPYLIKSLKVHDNDFQSLAEKISSLILKLKQPNRCSSYTTYFTKWKKWAASFREAKVVQLRKFTCQYNWLVLVNIFG